MNHAIQHRLTLETVECPNCHVPFAFPDYWIRDLRKTGRSFYCPAGHSMSWTPGPTEADRLRNLLEEANRSKTALIAENGRAWNEVAETEKRLKKAAADAKRVEKRIHAGVCPCCNRTFVNLQRHMATKHKEQVVS